MTVTSSSIEGAFLEPGMDAVAHNLDQYDPSPAVDSQLERIRALTLGLPPSPEREVLISEVEAAIASNLRERSAQHRITGAADQLITDLRRIERNGNASERQALSAKAVAHWLRKPLECMASPEGRPVEELLWARGVVRKVLNRVPLLILLSKAVERELGQEKFAALEKLAQKNSAARSVAAGAAEERGSAQHAQP